MQTTWILAADSSRARIFQELDDEHHLQEIEDFANPAGHALKQEILEGIPDRRNFNKDALGARHDGEPAVDPIEHENEKFSKTVGDFLYKARNEHRYDKLYVIAPPKFLGLLRKNLGKETQKLVADEIDKDVSRYDKNGLEAFVREWRH
jgi:protein required for attachment to host cells